MIHQSLYDAIIIMICTDPTHDLNLFLLQFLNYFETLY